MRPIGVALVFALGLAAFPGGAVSGGLDEKTLPYLTGLGRLEVAKDYAAAGPNQAVYTLAISGAGSWDSLDDPRVGSEERARNVLQRCEHRAHKRCLLVFENGKRSGELTLRPSGLTYAARFELATVPFIPRDVLAQIGPRYMAAKPHRAMAISAMGMVGVAAGAGSGDEAGARALEMCQKSTGAKHCFVYSVDDTVLFNQTTKIY